MLLTNFTHPTVGTTLSLDLMVTSEPYKKMVTSEQDKKYGIPYNSCKMAGPNSIIKKAY